MKAEFYKVRGTEMEEMMKRGNNNEISSMISKKQQALAEALEILYIMKKQLINFFHGRFGNKVLKAKYREWWVRFWYGVGALTCTLLFFGMIQFLSWISDLINYVF